MDLSIAGDKSDGEKSLNAGRERPDYTLDGLLVTTSPQPTLEWVRRQFTELNSLPSRSDQVVLPSTSWFYTSHVIGRLVDLVMDEKFGLVGATAHPPGESRLETAAGPDNEPDCLECYIQDRSRSLKGEDEGSPAALMATGQDGPQLMLIKDGRLHPLAESGYSVMSIAIGIILLLWLVFVLLQPASQNPGGFHPITRLKSLVSWRFVPSETGAYAEHVDMPSMVVVIGAILLIGLSAMWLDARVLGLPVRTSPVPDGHSVLPSQLIMGAAGLLACYLPYRFRSEFSDRGLLKYRLRPQEPAKISFLRRWVPPLEKSEEISFDNRVNKWVKEEVKSHLVLTRTEACMSAGVA